MGRAPKTKTVSHSNIQSFDVNINQDSILPTIGSLLTEIQLERKESKIDLIKMDAFKSNVYFTGEFKCWLNAQIQLGYSYFSFFICVYFFKLINFFFLVKINQKIKMIDKDLLPTNIASKCCSLFTDEFLTDSFSSELLFYSMLKDKVYQTYRRHLNESATLNEINQRLKSRDYIDSSVENVFNEDLLTGVKETFNGFFKWFSDYIRFLPGFKNLNIHDLELIVLNGTHANLDIHLKEYFSKNECYFITNNGYQMSRVRLNEVFGTFTANLYFLAFSMLENFQLTECELALFCIYMAMTQCQGFRLLNKFFFKSNNY